MTELSAMLSRDCDVVDMLDFLECGSVSALAFMPEVTSALRGISFLHNTVQDIFQSGNASCALASKLYIVWNIQGHEKLLAKL